MRRLGVSRVLVAVAAIAILAAGYASKSISSSGTTIANQRFADNSGGTAVTGGTLTMLGVSDVDYMDPNVSYYSIGYLALRMFSRQLYTYPAEDNKTTDSVPDLATGAPVISNGGTTYAITIRQGAMWNTTPPRQVTAADVVLGVKRSCNPVQPFGGTPDFNTLIAGYQAFCTAFAAPFTTTAPTVAQVKSFIDSHSISGVSVDPSDPETVVFTLTHPASYFADMLALPVFSPAPVEFLNYLPASLPLAQHMISDGPYEIKSYNPGKSITFVRNPAWSAASDPIRKAYVNEIDVTETGNQNGIEQEILTNSPSADMVWDTAVPPSDIPSLIAANDPRLSLQTEYASNPYVLFNTVSPNQGGALSKVAVRQALEYGINRMDLVQNAGGPTVAPPLTQILPPGINGASPTHDMYPYNVTKAKQLLASAGYPNGLSLKFLYRSDSDTSTKDFETLQSDLGKIGIKLTGVPTTQANFYVKYLEVPSTAKAGDWDLSLAGWSPDWYGDAALSFFEPLFDGRILPPTSSNFGLFNDPALNTIIDAAGKATTTAAAGALWNQADQEVMKQAAIFPISDPNEPQIHGTQVHNCVYMAIYQNCDPTNIWLSK